VLGASTYTFAEATRSQNCQTGLGSNAAASPSSAGPEIVGADNLAQRVSRAPLRPDMQPQLTATWRALTAWRGAGAGTSAARQGKAEFGVQVG